jgi:hypothetical protein
MKGGSMLTQYKAQWLSKTCCESLRKSQRLHDVLLLDTFEGFIVIEPADKSFGDGPVLSRDECNYELQPAWYAGPITRLTEARQRLGLNGNFAGSL